MNYDTWKATEPLWLDDGESVLLCHCCGGPAEECVTYQDGALAREIDALANTVHNLALSRGAYAADATRAASRRLFRTAAALAFQVGVKE